MKIHIARSDDARLGGGWSWISNMKKAIPEHLTNYEDCDIYLIPSPSMVSKEEVDQAQADGKKIVLRIDNIVRNSRNRNTGMSRMKRFAEQSNAIVYQSEFSRALLMPFISLDGHAILNSVDTDIFHPRGRREDTVARYVYSRVNRDETKNWEMARFIYQQQSFERGNETMLNIVGHFSPELVEYNFDFYMDEQYRYWGTVADPNTLASIYRDSDYLIYTFWNDACSNTLIEALCCGCTILDSYQMAMTGGTPEILSKFYSTKEGSDYFKLERMAKEYLKVMENL